MVEGAILGLMTFGSMLLTFWKLPGRLQRWILRHKLLTDAGAGVLVFLVLGAISKSTVAIVGAITASLLVGVTLEVAGGKNAKQLVRTGQPTSS